MFRFSGYNDINTIIKRDYILIKCLRNETLRGDIVMDYIIMVCNIHHSIHVVSLIFNVTLSGERHKERGMMRCMLMCSPSHLHLLMIFMISITFRCIL